MSSTPTLRFNLPTILTLSRVFMIPVFIVLAPEHPAAGAVIFTLASVTDWFDGYLARRMGAVTKFGIIMDPIADKFLVISALVLLVDMVRLPVWIAAALIIREFLVTALRAVALSKGIIIPAETGGKIKAALQYIAIVCLILGGELLGLDLYDLGMVLMYTALVLAVTSGVKYTISFWKAL
ncbi:MAG: CDP-diacylglycerol--glycerol-3-phosphate 3-phosphatidyltransferase [Nitrospiraceae bacterium]|nr:CDP-diacylglycerol--glycerol-3-phosphate 3-phosphatidyltransferase [Nitrospiraceae bacterium]